MTTPGLQSQDDISRVEANRQVFNDFSADYDTKPWQQRISAKVRAALEDRKEWIGVRWALNDTPTASESNSSLVTLLDYACGTGAITKALGPYVDSVKGIDISDKMVARYNEAVGASGLTSQQAHADVGDLCAPGEVPESLCGPEYFDFDVAAIGLGFHHFDSPALAVKRLADRLKIGSGVLVIVDFLPFVVDKDLGRDSHGHASHGHQHGSSGELPRHQHLAHSIGKAGFTKEEMKKLYEDAGVGADFDFDVLPEPVVLGEGEKTSIRELFISKGRRVA